MTTGCFAQAASRTAAIATLTIAPIIAPRRPVRRFARGTPCRGRRVPPPACGTFIASGDCLAILPETAASVPRCPATPRTRPCGSSSRTRTVDREPALGPDREEAVIAEGDPDGAVGAGGHDVAFADLRADGHGQSLPPRSMAAEPFEVLTTPTSLASAWPGSTNVVERRGCREREQATLGHVILPIWLLDQVDDYNSRGITVEGQSQDRTPPSSLPS